MSADRTDPRIDLISRIGQQMDDMQRSRAWWFLAAVIGWASAAYLYFT